MPTITLLSDFGLRDGYVASMKGVILGIAPSARIVDISHLVAPQDIRSASFVLFTAYRFFPAGTVHLAVVDPGVGSERKALAVRTQSSFFVGPDNGIFSLILHHEAGYEARSLENPDLRLHPVSATFHGRDIFAPAAAHLARGIAFDQLGPVTEPVTAQWSLPIETKSGLEGEIIHIDRFGNCVTNVALSAIERFAPSSGWTVQAGNIRRLHVCLTYSQVRPGEALALEGSSGYIEIAVNRGSAAASLGLHTGAPVFFVRQCGCAG